MELVYISLRYSDNQQIDLALPYDVPNQVIAESIAIALKIYTPNLIWALSVERVNNSPRKLPPATTLSQARILCGSTIMLTNEAPPAYLQSGKDIKFILKSPITVIGRGKEVDGKGIDIDLMELDDPDGPVISRLQAEIHFNGEKYLISDGTTGVHHWSGSANGTFVNGYELRPRELRTLTNGDEIYLAPPEAGGIRFLFIWK